MKKAVGFGMTIVVSLLLLAIGFLLFVSAFGGNILDFITRSGDTSACKISLFSGRSAEKCLEEAKIFSDKVEVNGKDFMKKGDESTQDMAKEALAKMLVMCLSKGGGYNSKSFTVENWVSTERVCLQCYTVTLDNDVGRVTSFTDYLKDTKIKGFIPEKKYLEALTRDAQHLKAYMEYGMGLDLAPSQGTFEFKPNQNYIVFFIGFKSGYLTSGKDRLLAGVSGDFLTLVFGAQDTYFAYIAESSKLKNACDRLVN